MEKESRPSIIEVLASEQFFKPAFRDLSTWRNWEIFLKALYGIEMSPDELELFKSSTCRTEPSSNGYHEVYAIVGRRGGKSRIAALIAVYEALLGGWDQKLSKGERGWIFIIANDKAQAKIVLNYVKGLLELFPDMMDRNVEEGVGLKNGISIAVKTCSFRASRGFTTCCVIGDEIAFWRDENSVNPAEEVINSILPGLMEGARLLGISTPYAKFGFLYQQYKDYFARDDSDILVWKAPTLTMNPTYSQSTIDRLIKRDRVVFSAEYQADFREDISNFLPEEMIRVAMTHGPLPPEPGKRYLAFLDPSGGRSDSMTLAIAHRDGEKIILDYIEEQRPPFNPDSVVKEFSNSMRVYSIVKATSDRYAGVWPSSAFQKEGIQIEMSELTSSELYLEFQPLLAMGRVELLNDDRLSLQFQSLERRTRSGGRDSVDHPPGYHDDLSNAVAGVCVLASRKVFWDEKERESRMPVRPSSPSNTFREIVENFEKELGGRKPLEK